jgi:hypothetical protein
MFYKLINNLLKDLGRGRRKKNTEKLAILLATEHLNSDGEPEVDQGSVHKSKNSRKVKRRKAKDTTNRQ